MSQTKAQLISDLVQALNFTGTSSAPANGMYLSAANTIKLATNSNGRLTIDSSGNATFTGTCTATTFIGALTGTASNASGATGDFSIADKIVHTGDTNTAIRFPSADVITAETAGTERFRIDSGGRISIGNNPTVHTSTKFHVEDTGELNVKFEGSTSTLGARLTLQNNDATANSYCQYAFNDAGGQSTSAIQGINTDNDNNYGELAFLTRSAQGSPPTERIRIDKNGKLGIGTTTPAVALDVQGGTSNTGIAVRSTDTRAQVSYIDNATTGIGCVCTGGEGDDFFIRTGSDGAKKLTIKADGKVGIGTTSPSRNLHLVGSNAMILIEGSGGNGRQYSLASSDDTTGAAVDGGNPGTFAIYDDTANTSRLVINSSGNVGIGTTAPESVLQVQGAQGYADSASTLATSTSKSALRVRGSNNSSDSLWMGVESTDANPYIQGSNGVGNNAKNLLLNPHGGKVGIGKAANAQRTLDIQTGTNENGFCLNSIGTPPNYHFDIRDDNVVVLRVGPTGNVGMGNVEVPNWPLTVQRSSGTTTIGCKNTGGNASVYIEASDGNTAKLELVEAGTGSYSLQVGNDNALMFFDDAQERLRIKSNGQIDLGTSGTNKAQFCQAGSNHYIVGQAADNVAALEVYSQHGSSASKLSFGVYDNRTGSKSASFLVRGDGSVEDSKGPIRSVPATEPGNANYTLAASDAGKYVDSQGTGTEITVPSGTFSQGDVVTIVRATSGDATIKQGSGLTMYHSADGANTTTGDRVIAQRGMVTMIFVNPNYCYISGAGLS